MQQVYSKLKTRIQSSQKNVLCLHRRPDGDSIGSNLAFASVLKAAGKDVDIYSRDPIPAHLQFLEGSDDIIVQPPAEIRWQNYDTFWALDMSASDMIGDPTPFPPDLDIVVIDHHRTNEGWGKENLVDESAVSCTAVLYDFFEAEKISFDEKAAMALLTGLTTDTGFFIHIFNGRPLKIAGDLIDTYKLNYQQIVFQIQKQLNIEDVLFLGNALSLLTINYEKKAALLPIPYKSWINFGAAGENNYLLTGYLSSLNGTDFGVLLIEEKPGKFRVQFRSRDREFDVAAIAAKLGGGGHKNAAGATVFADTVDEAVNTILSNI